MSTQGRDDRRAVVDEPKTAPECEHPGASGADDRRASYDGVDEASEESMDASDPPSFNPTTSVGPPGHADSGRRD